MNRKESAKNKWGKLTTATVELARGRFELLSLVGSLQTLHGITQYRPENELDIHKTKLET